MSEHEQIGFSKRVVELPDGRCLIYYDFGTPAVPAEPSPTEAKDGGEAAPGEA